MRKLLVSLALILTATGVVLLALMLVLNRLIARNRDQIVSRVEATLGRPVAVDAIKVSLWGGPGLRLDNVRVADDPQFSETTFVSAAALTVRASLWSVVRRRPEADRFDLE